MNVDVCDMVKRKLTVKEFRPCSASPWGKMYKFCGNGEKFINYVEIG